MPDSRTVAESTERAWDLIGICVAAMTKIMSTWLTFEKHLDHQVWWIIYNEVFKEELMQRILGVSKDLVDDNPAVYDLMEQLIDFVRAQRECTAENIDAIRKKFEELKSQ